MDKLTDSAKVKIYTTSWCAFCRAEKRFLARHNIAYQEVDVEADQEQAAKLIKLSGQMGVPFTVITKPDGSDIRIIGFDQPRIARELGLT